MIEVSLVLPPVARLSYSALLLALLQCVLAIVIVTVRWCTTHIPPDIDNAKRLTMEWTKFFFKCFCGLHLICSLSGNLLSVSYCCWAPRSIEGRDRRDTSPLSFTFIVPGNCFLALPAKSLRKLFSVLRSEGFRFEAIGVVCVIVRSQLNIILSRSWLSFLFPIEELVDRRRFISSMLRLFPL